MALLELAFRGGTWDRLARPDSHLGTSVRVKRALQDPRWSRIDTVALGSSRAVYGFDHAAPTKVAKASGQVHANLAMAGSHWLTLRVLLERLRQDHPEIRGGVIGLSIADFEGLGNGAYELAIVTPLRDWGDSASVSLHVAPERGKLASWGVFSSLMAWRADIRDFVSAPRVRLAAVAKANATDAVLRQAYTLDDRRDICAAPINSLAECSELPKDNDNDSPVARQCRTLASRASARRSDRGPAINGAEDPSADLLRSEVRDLLGRIDWKTAPVFVLLPTHPV